MPDRDQTQPPASPSFLDMLRRRFGEAKNTVGEWSSDALAKLGLQGQPQYTETENPVTHRPMILAKDQAQFDDLTRTMMDRLTGGKGDWGSTFMKPGDVQLLGGGPLANLVRSRLSTGPVSVLGPGTFDPSKRPADTAQGVFQHETAHQIMQDTPISMKQLLSALPPAVAQRIRDSGYTPDEVMAHLAASGVDDPKADPRTTQFYRLGGKNGGGITAAEAKQARDAMISQIAKQDPHKAAQLMQLTSVNAPSSAGKLAAMLSPQK